MDEIKLESLESDIFKKFETNKISLYKYIGARGPATRRRHDCSGGGQADDSGYRRDSIDYGDSVRSKDGCNELMECY